MTHERREELMDLLDRATETNPPNGGISWKQYMSILRKNGVISKADQVEIRHELRQKGLWRMAAFKTTGLKRTPIPQTQLPPR